MLTRSIRWRPFLAAALLLLSTQPARSQPARSQQVRSQQVRSLAPDRYQVRAASAVGLRLLAGKSPQDWPEQQISWLFVRVAGTQLNLDTLASLPADASRSAPVKLERAGIAMIGLDLRPRVESLPAAEFQQFLSERAGLEPDPDATGQVRVRRVESFKLLVRALDNQGELRNSADSQSKSGQQVEIRPLADPLEVRLNRDLLVRVYLPQGASVGALVLATHLPSGTAKRFRTGPGGTGHFTVDTAGEWLVECHSVRALDDDPEAEVELHSATLRFEVPAVPEEPKVREGQR